MHSTAADLLCLSVFLQRYDPVTTGIGSLLVTGYCVVAHHQSVGEALNIAACATVLGMVGFGTAVCYALQLLLQLGHQQMIHSWQQLSAAFCRPCTDN
jgi:hypothetical protein